MIELILGLRAPTHGSMEVLGHNPNSLEPKHLKDLVFLSHDVNLKGDISIRDFLDFSSHFYTKHSKEMEDDLVNSLEIETDAKIGSLSTGQQKKVQIIAALSANTDLILIDEITAVLDPEVRHQFFSKLTELNKFKQKTILLATNIAEDLEQVTFFLSMTVMLRRLSLNLSVVFSRVVQDEIRKCKTSCSQ